MASTIDVIFSAPKDCSTEVIQGTEWTLKALASYHMNTMDIPYARFVHANGGDESKIYRNGDTYYKPQHEPMFAIPLDLESVQYPKAKKMVAPTFGPNSCGRKILGGGRKGQKCANAIFRYGRCRYHLSLWRGETPSSIILDSIILDSTILDLIILNLINISRRRREITQIYLTTSGIGFMTKSVSPGSFTARYMYSSNVTARPDFGPNLTPFFLTSNLSSGPSLSAT